MKISELIRKIEEDFEPFTGIIPAYCPGPFGGEAEGEVDLADFFEKEIEVFEEDIKQLREKVNELQKKIKDFSDELEHTIISCPHCGQYISFKTNFLIGIRELQEKIAEIKELIR
jgi:predicted RNase H-like nuclease (RuvC/YqgF family)